ncbi:MAG: sulfurtransferase [Cyclobacteriaceae bacterium]
MKDSATAIISADDVKSFFQQPEVVFVDARGGNDAYDRYQSGHVSGAVFMDLETDLSKKSADAARGGRHPLPDPEAFGHLLGKVGIKPSQHLLVYDDKAGANAAARFWWMMKAARHSSIQVVDGGFAALSNAGLPILKGPAALLPPQSQYPVKSWMLPTADLEAVARAREGTDSLVLDVREHYRYIGESEPIDLVAGHIPGAQNVPYSDNLEADGKFRSPHALAAQYKALIGNRDVKKVIVHCGSGVTACHTLLAMEFAGISGANLYVGSWSEWSRNNKPIAIGQKP